MCVWLPSPETRLFGGVLSGSHEMRYFQVGSSDDMAHADCFPYPLRVTAIFAALLPDGHLGRRHDSPALRAPVRRALVTRVSATHGPRPRAAAATAAAARPPPPRRWMEREGEGWREREREREGIGMERERDGGRGRERGGVSGGWPHGPMWRGVCVLVWSVGHEAMLRHRRLLPRAPNRVAFGGRREAGWRHSGARALRGAR